MFLELFNSGVQVFEWIKNFFQFTGRAAHSCVLEQKNQHFITFLSPLTAQTLFSKCAKTEKLEKTTDFEIAAVNSFLGQIANGLR